MGMMLPNELVWILDKLGSEWPDVEEDEVRRAGQVLAQVRELPEGTPVTEIQADGGRA